MSEFADTVYLISSKQGLLQKGSPKEIFCLKDELKKYNLKEPDILRLFNLLNDRGFDLGTPIAIEEAADILAQRLSKSIKNHQ
ncbi:MAG: hypothetical protein MZV70_76735 [Desulfobacterales bacterium]|nr:hypothetical protein [Desulfobacterales bacterium]